MQAWIGYLRDLLRNRDGLGHDVDGARYGVLPVDEFDEFEPDVGVDALERDEVDARLLEERGRLVDWGHSGPSVDV